MVGRTPEYLGKKIQSYEVKMAMLLLAGLSRFPSSGSPRGLRSAGGGLAGLNNAGPARLERNPPTLQLRHGQQRKRVRGLTADTPWYNTSARPRDG